MRLQRDSPWFPSAAPARRPSPPATPQSPSSYGFLPLLLHSRGLVVNFGCGPSSRAARVSACPRCSPARAAWPGPTLARPSPPGTCAREAPACYCPPGRTPLDPSRVGRMFFSGSTSPTSANRGLHVHSFARPHLFPPFVRRERWTRRCRRTWILYSPWCASSGFKLTRVPSVAARVV
jgi:hypothetical protein